MPNLSLSFASKDESLSVRRFSVRERMSSLFEVSILAVSELDDLDLDAFIGKGATFQAFTGLLQAPAERRIWSGICCQMDQVQAETKGLSTYRLRIVPSLFRATLRRNNRIFQHASVPDIALKLLREWSIIPEIRLSALYATYEYRVQYAESDFAFLSRLLEDAGISFYFSSDEQHPTLSPDITRLVLSDAPQARERRPGRPLLYVDNPNRSADEAYITKVSVGGEVRPGAVTLRDFDFRRRPDYPLFADTKSGLTDEARCEQYHYIPGAFIVEGASGSDTPVADDRGVARASLKEGEALAARWLESERHGSRRITYETNATDLGPGTVFAIDAHPRKDLDPARTLLVIASTFQGTHDGEWTTTGEAVFAAAAYRPQRQTPKPRVVGVQSALVVGPPGEEIHTDEFGRVRVQFHWDRESAFDDASSCWIRVSQAWAGGRSGLMTLPRVGHEVLVDFFDGDPDRPVIVGRIHNATTRAPFALPAEKTKSGFRSESSPGGDGFNELSFDDAKDRELIYLHAQRNYTTVVGQDSSCTVGKGRASVVGTSDSVDAGDSQSVTVGGGVGYTINKDGTILLTNGAASITLTPGGISIDAKGDIAISADGVLKLSGKEVQIAGAPNIFLNCSGAQAASVAAVGSAKAPGVPDAEHQARHVHRADDARAAALPIEPSGTAERLPTRRDVVTFESLVAQPPPSPDEAPSVLELDPTLAVALLQARRSPTISRGALVRGDGTHSLTFYSLAEGESLASLPSTLDMKGAALVAPTPTLDRLSARDIESLVNAGSSAGIFHVGNDAAVAAPYIALRTARTPFALNGRALKGHADALLAAGISTEAAHARAFNKQGVALYRERIPGSFTKIDP